MAAIVDFLVQQFYTNQFMTAAVVAAPAAVLTYAARSIPAGIWATIKRTATTDLRFNSDMENYERVQTFVLDNVVSKRWSRTFKYHTKEVYNREGEHFKHESSLGVGYGNHFGWWHGTPVWIQRRSEEGNATEKFKESLELTFLGRNLSGLNRFVASMEAHVANEQEEERVGLYVNDGSSWDRMASLPLRNISTVFTNDKQGERAVEHVRRFVASKEWYRRRGLPHHTGILFEGVPGTGKTSLIHAVASETGRNLFYLNLGAVTEEKEITGLMADRRRWDNAILVIEDVDSSGAAVRRDAQEGATVTLSTLLNVLDGILSPDGLVVMATTNHPEALDPALIRPGRFDLAMRLGPLEWAQFADMAELFEMPPERIAALHAVYRPTPGATLRAMMLSQDLDALEHYFSQPAGEEDGMQLELPSPPPAPVGLGRRRGRRPFRGLRELRGIDD